MDKFLLSSQPTEINNEINRLRFKAFKTNSQDDIYDLCIFMLKSWSSGDLSDTTLAREVYGRLT